MRWTVAALGVLLAACGGRSQSHESEGSAAAGTGGTLDAGGRGSTSGAGTNGAGVGGSVGMSMGMGMGGRTGMGMGVNSGGRAPLGPGMSGGFGATNPGRGMMGGGGAGSGDVAGSPGCQMYESTTDVVAACSQLGECPRDFASAVTNLGPNIPPYIYARVGCGVTSVILNAGLGGSAWTFDSDGNLIGYSLFSDTSWGPCGQASYEAGTTYDACTEYRDCALNPDGTLAEPCLCPCPDPPPVDGVVESPSACVYEPGPYSFQCPDYASSWDSMNSLGFGTIRKGCGDWTQVEWVYQDLHVRCVYGENDVVIGAERDVTADTCSGVTGWRYGETYPTCGDDQSCAFGGDDAVFAGTACKPYPFF